ncbi:MAG: T9SS type A sorting domain-containing protein [Bacteroidota bacterium]|nr:T9SS type A sorting domain-containing protein [Bacteroidota bacterium]
MVSGDSISWSYNVNPAGATATVEIWDDVNGNGSIDAGDVLWQSFTQTDGVAGGNGPGDMDSTANGAVVFGPFPVGLAPVKYVMKFSQGGTSLTVAGTVTHLASPAHTISGTVTVPAGKSAANIFVEAEPSNHGDNKPFWDGVTDVNGNYTVEMNADTAGNPWSIRLSNNPLAPAVVTPTDTAVTVAASAVTGINFSIVTAAAQVDGYLKDDTGAPLVSQGVYASVVLSDNNNLYEETQTDASGFFALGFSANDVSQSLSSNQSWRLQSSVNDNGSGVTGYLIASRTLPILHNGDSLFYNLVSYKANSTIQGTVTIDGSAPPFPLQIAASSTGSDTVQSYTWAESGTGNFSINVTNKISSYTIIEWNLPPQYSQPNVTAHPGDTGVKVNITTTGVAEGKTLQPLEFSLAQNYPNPFNPTTQLRFTIADFRFVSLKIYDVLGREVVTLVNERKAPGTYEVQFDGSKLGSGMYFYTLRAGSFTETKRMTLVK